MLIGPDRIDANQSDPRIAQAPAVCDANSINPARHILSGKGNLIQTEPDEGTNGAQTPREKRSAELTSTLEIKQERVADVMGYLERT